MKTAKSTIQFDQFYLKLRHNTITAHSASMEEKIMANTEKALNKMRKNLPKAGLPDPKNESNKDLQTVLKGMVMMSKMAGEKNLESVKQNTGLSKNEVAAILTAEL